MPSELIDLSVDRPVPGGRMFARHEGRVVLVGGAIPGERVRVRIERTTKSVTFAEVVEVLEASPDRRPAGDPSCGGSHYAHIEYERQLALKSEIVADAFRRIGRHTLERPVVVLGSAERGYRLRARLHVADGRAGFFREGTHSLCDAGPTGQLMPATMTAVGGVLQALAERVTDVAAVVVAENVAGTDRVIHLEPRAGAQLGNLARAESLSAVAGVTGVTVTAGKRQIALAGSPTVTDSADALFGAGSPLPGLVAWTRHATSFFQGNRFLTGALLRAVLDATGGRNEIVDLYSGVGLFAVALAARGANVVAVEGDFSSGGDLESNAGPWRERLRVIRGSVEEALAHAADEPPDAVIVDPPRTGVSPEALGRLIGWRVPRLVYVSCDAPTLARDAGQLFKAGYALSTISALDLFPNTPHVETLATFVLRQDEQD
jgi:23S rRNA (uracil1939-C5)-methyltransferase